MSAELVSPECQSQRVDSSIVCPDCSAPPSGNGDQRIEEEEVRENDLQPYLALRYIARLFKVLALLMLIMMVGEVVAGISAEAAESLPTLIGEVTQMFVLAGLMWGGGDITLLLIDAGHDLRVARILLGRINAEAHRQAEEKQ